MPLEQFLLDCPPTSEGTPKNWVPGFSRNTARKGWVPSKITMGGSEFTPSELGIWDSIVRYKHRKGCAGSIENFPVGGP